MSYDYSYDNNGNITEIKQNGKLTNKYVYDSLNELKEEYDYVNKFYINYSYDGAGNLQNKYEQVLDPNYGYPTGTQHGNTYEYTDTSWKDKLTKVNGSNIFYDANGNPLSYRDGMSFEWENGRILKNINTSDKAVQMSYDSNGMRTQKSVDGVKTNYYYDSNKNLIALVKGNDTLLFYYDSDGSATSFSYNGTMYFYVKNLQGDVIRIIDLAGTEVASYVYDAWGNIKDTKGEPTIREINPIRYRGYVYDTETSLYYLQSRYYDPFTSRFLNADDAAFVGTTGTALSGNIFAYCENNPIVNADKSGYVAANVIGAVIGGIVGAIGGYFLTNWLADKLNLHGWKRNLFVWGLTAVIGAAAAAIGYFIGPYVAKIAVKLGKYIVSLVHKGKIVLKKLSHNTKSAICKLTKSACFVEGTQIITINGKVPIEKIREGDLVWAKDPQTGAEGYKSVTRTFINKTNSIVKITVDSEEINTTPKHPFWVIDKGWMNAEELEVGDKLLRNDNSISIVKSICTETLTEGKNVYNFEVADYHTYFVSDLGILVHNKCAQDFAKKNAKQIEKIYKLKKGEFHRNIKPYILKDAGKALNKVGRNPDIYLSSTGQIKLVSTVRKGVSVVTNLNIFNYL